MKHEIDPKETNRAMAFELWMKSPMPMVALAKTFDVTRLRKLSRRKDIKFNILSCAGASVRLPDGYQYTDQFCNPMVMWGRYRIHWFKVTLPISFQFHHVEMDGSHAARFLEELQKAINTI